MAIPPSPARKPLARLIPRSGAPPLLVEAAVARIGADSAADVVMTEPTVAAIHASIRLQGGVWMLEDLGSEGGTWVDDETAIEPLPVAPGSVIRLGTVELLFDPQDQWEDSPTGAVPAVPVDVIDRAHTPGAHVPLFMIERASARPGWLPWLLVGAVVLMAVAAILLSGGSR